MFSGRVRIVRPAKFQMSRRQIRAGRFSLPTLSVCFHLLTERFGEIKLSGQYHEITPPTTLVYTWHWEGAAELEGESSLVSVEFVRSGQSTEVRLKHEQLPSAQVRDDHGEGWNGTFDKLQKYLAP
jgi:uncharacterized protein YndB with AHSA1/START domain